MTTFRWGIFGTGAISAKFVAGLATARDAEPAFIASRSREKAQRFAAATGISRAIAGYAEAAAEGEVDAVYVATPPALHASHALLCLQAGLPVLVEKPMAASAADVRVVADAAQRAGVFAMEAMWTRFLPAAQVLRARVQAGATGDVRLVSGSFGTSQVPDPRNGMFDPALGGGAIAHLGAYPLSLAQWLLGTPSLVRAVGTVGPTGVEEDAAFSLSYPGGVLGSFVVSLRAWAQDDFCVLGTEGMLRLEGSIVRPTGVRLTREPPRAYEEAQLGWRPRLRQHALVHRAAQLAGRSSRGRGHRHRHHYRGNGYHYQADEVRARVREGAVETPVMPLADSIAVAETSDAIRDALGLRGQRENKEPS